MVLKIYYASRSAVSLPITLNATAFLSTLPRTDKLMYACPVDAEPLDRYRKGGYHPILLGSFLSDGRYKILHKLGWGGYSTVWAARDRKSHFLGTYVAVKICLSERECDRIQRELNMLKKLASKHAHSQHVVRLVDNFNTDGPSGKHQCLVFEHLGPSLSDAIDTRSSDGRLPGEIAKSITEQALLGLDFLHQQKIAHGDLHTRNLAFALDAIDDVSEHDFIETLGRPEIGHAYRSNGKDLESGIPKYIVRPARSSSLPLSKIIKIVDFVRAPEFGDRLDYRVDLWSLRCLILEIFVGQPPFDSFLITPKFLVDQMQELTDEPLPERWLGLWGTMSGDVASEDPKTRLQEWLEEMYFDGERKEDLTAQDIGRLGHIIQKLLRFDSSGRASARKILDDPLFRD
ncbi:serine protein kinase [Aspergillus foveolatus]|uniref:serine protein kinase n=1 Tax=Aspergillus foveolatus TaxID=210207 RepID=UPI003CCCE531